MRERNTLSDEAIADVVHLRTPTMPVWDDEGSRDDFIAEANRRKAAGESLEGMALPIHLEQEPHE
jgi:hypothetical protein